MALSSKLVHIVLIPGFGGFDALGKIHYYAGVTSVFRQWTGGKPAVLHYFDNLPTAAVVTRAARLAAYLASRMARGEIQERDDVVLVGHSTGGLDIRQLISDLHDRPQSSIYVDGGILVKREEIRRRISRVVFLSVPHWGTNIADWVRSHPWLRQAVVTELRAVVAGSQVRLLEKLEDNALGAAASLTGADLAKAIQDALAEASVACGERNPCRIADAHEAASELNLYVSDIASDFHVIDDLTSQAPDAGPSSPAHFTPEQRKRESDRWREAGIGTLSYCTVARSPFRFHPGAPAPPWDLLNPFTYPEVAKDPVLSAATDVTYRACYRACAGGPFSRPDPGGQITRRLDGAPENALELWDNDGIVNTLSMPWPYGDNVLVAADHLDIVGHFQTILAGRKRSASAGQPAREYRSYDLLKSAAPFHTATFEQIWSEIFDFSMG